MPVGMARGKIRQQLLRDARRSRRPSRSRVAPTADRARTPRRSRRACPRERSRSQRSSTSAGTRRRSTRSVSISPAYHEILASARDDSAPRPASERGNMATSVNHGSRDGLCIRSILCRRSTRIDPAWSPRGVPRLRRRRISRARRNGRRPFIILGVSRDPGFVGPGVLGSTSATSRRPTTRRSTATSATSSPRVSGNVSAVYVVGEPA